MTPVPGYSDTGKYFQIISRHLRVSKKVEVVEIFLILCTGVLQRFGLVTRKVHGCPGTWVGIPTSGRNSYGSDDLERTRRMTLTAHRVRLTNNTVVSGAVKSDGNQPLRRLEQSLRNLKYYALWLSPK
eukprot:2428600-Rhodomonas_salina.2